MESKEKYEFKSYARLKQEKADAAKQFEIEAALKIRQLDKTPVANILDKITLQREFEFRMKVKNKGLPYDEDRCIELITRIQRLEEIEQGLTYRAKVEPPKTPQEAARTDYKITVPKAPIPSVLMSDEEKREMARNKDYSALSEEERNSLTLKMTLKHRFKTFIKGLRDMFGTETSGGKGRATEHKPPKPTPNSKQ